MIGAFHGLFCFALEPSTWHNCYADPSLIREPAMSEEDNPETVEKFDKAMRPEASADGLEWHSPREESFYIAGFAWYLKDGAFRRMPKKPKRPLPAGVD